MSAYQGRKGAKLVTALKFSVIIIIFTGSAGLGAELKVPGQYETITAALREAGAGDTILVEEGMYSVQTGEEFPLQVEVPVTIVTEPGAKAHIQGDDQHTVVSIKCGGVILRGLRITDGLGSAGINSMDGGGVCIFVGPSETNDVTIEDCIIEDNACPRNETYDGSGGGIYCGGTYCQCFTISIVDSVIRNNFVHGRGGGIFCALLSNVKTERTVVQSNTAEDNGGGISVDVYAFLQMDETDVLENSCPGDTSRVGWGGTGGGLACESFGIFTAVDCLFEHNTARYYGGAVFTQGSQILGADLCGNTERSCYLSDCRLAYNQATDAGGGIYVASGAELLLQESTLYWNDASQKGGGIFVASGRVGGGRVTLEQNCTLEGNESGGFGGGVYLDPRTVGDFNSTKFLGNASLFDGGAVYFSTGADAELFSENFDDLPLGPNVDETSAGDHVWTKTAPEGWTIDDSGVPGAGDPNNDGVTEWAGWSFADKDWWAYIGGQGRNGFLSGTNAIAVADSDEQDDISPHAGGSYNTFLTTPEIDISDVESDTVELHFDSSFYPKDSLKVNLTVAFDACEPVELFRWESDTASDNYKRAAPDEKVTVAIHNPPGARKMVLTFGYFDAHNDWWWAIDNIVIQGRSKQWSHSVSDCLFAYNSSARGFGGGIFGRTGAAVNIDHCSVVGNFAPRGRSGAYLQPGAIANITNSILYANAGGSIESEGAELSLLDSLNEDGTDPNANVICCDPCYVGWGDKDELYVDETAICGGMGTPGQPYCDLQEALNGFDLSLALNSPCIGAAGDGGTMGADTGVGGTAGNTLASLNIAAGEYDIRGRSIIAIGDIAGSGASSTTVKNAIFGHVHDSNIADISIAQEEMFGGITTRAEVGFNNCQVVLNNANSSGGGIYIAEGNCLLLESNVSNNTSDGDGAGIYASPSTSVSLMRSILNLNTTSSSGGGLLLATDTNAVILEDSEIMSNNANLGGGVHVSGQLLVSDANFVTNVSTTGGGIFVDTPAEVNICDANFAGNSASSNGGGLTCYGDCLISNCTFVGNEAIWGGGLDFYDGSLICHMCL